MPTVLTAVMPKLMMLVQWMTSKPMLLAGLGVAARVDERSHHHGDVADGRLYLFFNKRFGVRKFFFNLFSQFAPSNLSFLERKNTDANRGVGQIFGFHFYTIKVDIFVCHKDPLEYAT